MAITTKIRRLKIRAKIRGKISGTSSRPRLAVFRSNSAIYAQIIDDLNGTTIASFSTTEVTDLKGSKIELSMEVGKRLAGLAATKGITEIVFDRAGYLYHGRVKALAEGARLGGLKF